MPFKHVSSDTQGLLTYCLCLPLSFPDNAPTCVFIELAQSASPHAEPLLSPSVPHTDTDSLFSPPYGTRNQNLHSFPVSCRSVSQTNQLVSAIRSVWFLKVFCICFYISNLQWTTNTRTKLTNNQYFTTHCTNTIHDKGTVNYNLKVHICKVLMSKEGWHKDINFPNHKNNVL